MFICRNAERVHADLLKCRGTCSSVRMLKGYMINKGLGTPDDELAYLEKSASVSCSLSFSGVVIAAGPLSGTPASRSLAHGLSYVNVPVATSSRGAPVLEQKLLCDMARLSTRRYI